MISSRRKNESGDQASPMAEARDRSSGRALQRFYSRPTVASRDDGTCSQPSSGSEHSGATSPVIELGRAEATCSVVNDLHDAVRELARITRLRGDPLEHGDVHFVRIGNQRARSRPRQENLRSFDRRNEQVRIGNRRRSGLLDHGTASKGTGYCPGCYETAERLGLPPSTAR
jgi:hypothetical protein